MLFIAGQRADQLGGQHRNGLNNGYLDHVRRRPSGFNLYYPLRSDGQDPNVALGAVCSLPALRYSVFVLSVNWVDDFNPSSGAPSDVALYQGTLDSQVDRLAMWCKRQPRPILLRLGYEFDRFPGYYYDPATFRANYRHVVDRFRRAGAWNVNFVFASTNHTSFAGSLPAAPAQWPTVTETDFDAYYPGDDYVDWLGFSMWIPPYGDQKVLDEARERHKPVLLAETTPVRYNVAEQRYYPQYIGPAQAQTPDQLWHGWWQPMLDYIHANRDVIAGWHYICADWASDPDWAAVPVFANCDARPWTTRELLRRWNAAISASPFLEATPALFDGLAR